MARAQLIFKTRTAVQAGVVEMVVWRVPPSEHAFKYRLVLVKDGMRVLGYDNERGKGDHKHVGERELRYRFIDVDTLIRDFLRDVEQLT